MRETNMQDNGPAGLGSGEGQTDVTDQIDDLAQVEGLRGEQDEQQTPPAPSDEQGDKTAPIEMDEDFAGDLEELKLDDIG